MASGCGLRGWALGDFCLGVVPLAPCKIRLLFTRRAGRPSSTCFASLTSHPGFAFVAALLVSPHRFAFRTRGPSPTHVVELRQYGVWVWLARIGATGFCSSEPGRRASLPHLKSPLGCPRVSRCTVQVHLKMPLGLSRHSSSIQLDSCWRRQPHWSRLSETCWS